ncbi:MAG: hypothetical protein HQ518_25115 [Rhodopirellula sp.]|nr:hypothetical protein [Rhodopirellula sp.]
MIEQNRFFGNRSGTLAIAVIPDGAIRFQDNVFDGGHVGLNFSLQPTSPDFTPLAAFEVVNNTFVRCRSWIGLMNTDPSRTPFVLVNNLAVDVEEMEANPDQLQNTVAMCKLIGNFWERDPEFIEADSPLRDLASLKLPVDVGSRDRDEQGYLTYPAESTLRESGAGGPWSTRVGANVTNHPDRYER